MDTSVTNISRKLYRSRDAQIAGVCAGIANYYDLDALVVRILAILLMLMTCGVAGIVYLMLWVNIPLEPERLGPFDVAFESATLTERNVANYYLLPDEVLEKQLAKLPIRGLSITARVGIVVVFVLAYVVLSANLTVLIKGTAWWQYWPILLLTIGLFLLVVPIRSRYLVAWHAGGLFTTVLSIALLPMSLGVLSWSTIGYALDLFGPIFYVSIILYIAGIWGHSNIITFAGTVCFIFFCVLGIFFCALPGALETSGLSLQILNVPNIPLLFD